jgi:hypothetical protein
MGLAVQGLEQSQTIMSSVVSASMPGYDLVLWGYQTLKVGFMLLMIFDSWVPG